MTSRLIFAAAASGLLLGVPVFAAAQSAATSMPPASSAAHPTPPVNDPGMTSAPSSSMPATSMTPSATTGSAADTATSAPATASVKVGANVSSADGKTIGKISEVIPASGSTGAQVVIDNAGKKTTVLASSLSSDGSTLVWTDNSASTEPK